MSLFFDYFAYEGRKKLVISVLIALIVVVFAKSWFLKAFFISVFLFFLYIYYIPKNRVELLEKDAIFSPVDGQVTDIFEKDGKRVIEIYKNLEHGSVIKSPMSGIVEDIYFRHGAFLDLTSRKSHNFNERFTFVIKDDKKMIKVVSLAGKLGFFGHSFYKPKNNRCDFSEILGFCTEALFNIELPEEAVLNVKKGENLVAGISVLAYLKG
ncbi:hypothetical protein [Nitrosophilus labii]|uniref:hypothetical protein n=1 Tax=Nitrosophilus labii TaxID=2706014 RepID=UPI001656EA77|nr:hypothetical protein [Nitrosophilus labii]